MCLSGLVGRGDEEDSFANYHIIKVPPNHAHTRRRLQDVRPHHGLHVVSLFHGSCAY